MHDIHISYIYINNNEHYMNDKVNTTKLELRVTTNKIFNPGK